MKWNKKFTYPTSTRALIDGKRHYDISDEKLPSVTTILSATQSEEKRKSLENWRKRMGAQYADRVKDIAALRGTSMHSYLEGYIKKRVGVLPPTLYNYSFRIVLHIWSR